MIPNTMESEDLANHEVGVTSKSELRGLDFRFGCGRAVKMRTFGEVLMPVAISGGSAMDLGLHMYRLLVLLMILHCGHCHPPIFAGEDRKTPKLLPLGSLPL